MWNLIAEKISKTTGEKFEISDRRSVSGGCINQGYRLTDGKQDYFVKLNSAAEIAMFEAEAIGLKQMWETQTIRVPKPICYGVEGSSAYIVLEWLDLGGRGNNNA